MKKMKRYAWLMGVGMFLGASLNQSHGQPFKSSEEAMKIASREAAKLLIDRNETEVLATRNGSVNALDVKKALEEGKGAELAKRLFPEVSADEGLDRILTWYARAGKGFYRECMYERNLLGGRPSVTLVWKNGVWVLGPVLPNTDAAEAGLKTGQPIETIDGKPLPKEWWMEPTVMRWLTGMPGTEVEFGLGEEKKVKLTRGEGPPRAILEDRTIRFISLYSGFSIDMIQLARNIPKKKTWTIDLRSVPGGYVGEALPVLRAFAQQTENGVLMYWKSVKNFNTPGSWDDELPGKKGFRKNRPENIEGALVKPEELPDVSLLTVLVNKESSSAAEMLAEGLHKLGAKVEGGPPKGQRVAKIAHYLPEGRVLLIPDKVWSFEKM